MNKSVMKVRQANLVLLLSAASTAVRFAELTDWQYTNLVAAKAGRAQISTAQAQAVEQLLQVESGWMDQLHKELPADCRQRIQTLTAAAKSVSETELASLRRANLTFLVTDEWGAKTAFARELGWAQSRAQNLFGRLFSRSKSREVEALLGLPHEWFDRDHSTLEQAGNLPTEFGERLQMLRASSGGISRRAELRPRIGHSSVIPDVALSAISSPIVKALLQKLANLAVANRISEQQAMEMLTSLVAMDAPKVTE